MTITNKIASEGFKTLLKQEINRLKNSYPLLKSANSIVISTSYNAYSIYIFNANKETKIIPYNVYGDNNSLTIDRGGNVTIKPFEVRGGMYIEIYDSMDSGFEYGTGYSPKAKEFKIDTQGIAIKYSSMCIEHYEGFKGSLESNKKLKELYDLISQEFKFKNICNGQGLEPEPEPEPEGPEIPDGGGGGGGEIEPKPPTEPPTEPPTQPPTQPPTEPETPAPPPANYTITMYINGVTNGTLKMKRPQLEIGTVPTDWHPSPFDIDAKVNTKFSEFKVDIDKISSTVGEVEKTANSNTSKISRIEQTSNGIVSSVEEVKRTANENKAKISKIDQKADGITSTVQQVTETVNGQNQKISQIKQTADNVSISVQDKVDKDSIISSINLSTEGVKIKASKVQIEGDFITKSNLTDGVTTISGDNITTGTITGMRFSGTESMYMAASGTMSCDGKTYIKDLSIPETHPGWKGTGRFWCGAPASFWRDVKFGGSDYNQGGQIYQYGANGYKGIIRREDYKDEYGYEESYVKIDRMAIQKEYGQSPYLQIAGYESDKVFGANIWLSDRTMKENIKQLTPGATHREKFKIGLELIKELPHFEFNYLGDPESIKCGYVSQELQKLNSQLVTSIKQQDEAKTELLFPNTPALIPNLSLAIQEQQKIIEQLESRIAALEAKQNV